MNKLKVLGGSVAIRILKPAFSTSVVLFRKIPLIKSSFIATVSICQAGENLKDDAQGHWGHDFLIKQASVGVLNSSTTLLTIVTTSMIDAQDLYLQAMKKMLSLIEAKIIGSISHNDLCQEMIEHRAEIEERKNTWQAIEMQMTSMFNVMNAAAEMAFSAGAHYVGIAANERLSSSQQQFQMAKEKIRQLELELKLAQVQDIASDQVPSQN